MKNRTTQKKNKRHASKRTRKLVGGRIPRRMPRIRHQKGVKSRRQAKAAGIKTSRYRTTKERDLDISKDKLARHTKKINSRGDKLTDLTRQKIGLEGMLKKDPELKKVEKRLEKVKQKINKTEEKYNRSIKKSDKDMKAVAKATEKMAKSSLKKQKNLLKHGVTKSSMLRRRKSQIRDRKMLKTTDGIKLVGKKNEITTNINKIKKDLENKDLSPKERMDLVTDLGLETNKMTGVIKEMKAERNRYLGDKKKKFYNKRNIRKNQAKLENMTKKIDKLTNRDKQISAAKSIVDKRQAIKVDSAKGIILKETAAETAKAAKTATEAKTDLIKKLSDKNRNLTIKEKLDLANELNKATTAATETEIVAKAAAEKAEVAEEAAEAAKTAKTEAETARTAAAAADAEEKVKQALEAAAATATDSNV